MSKKKIYTVATSHLDTVWSWDFETTVSKYIYNTLVENIALFKKYPSYVFSFEGSYRYELMEEYYPELFKEMSEYIKEGRWNVTGSAYENGDVNCPSPEALFRNILFGNSYFEEKFGKRSKDIYLPDCFGFGWALPSIAYHSNLNGFTTQKLAWGSAYGVPFDIGKWYGVDGNYIYASVNPHDYYFTLTKLRDWDFVTKKLKENEKYGLDWTYMFHGIGDRGGAPEEATVKFVDNEIKKNESSDIEVVAASADQIYRDIENNLPQEVKDKLPEWKTELVMQNHGVGGYTSRAIGKRWNAKCQELADMAERTGVMASYFGTADYNESVLEKSWKRAIAHQFHDDTPGTSVQRAYRRSWNDYAMSMNQFAGEFEASLGAFSSLMKSNTVKGIPLLVSNPVEAERRGPVTIKLKNIDAPNVRIFDDKGREVMSQLLSDADGIKELLFIAEVPSLGVRVYDARPSDEECRINSRIRISDTEIENQKYIVTLNRGGNITSIIDKTDNDREILDKPVVLGLFNYTGSKEWPAWEMNFEEADKEPDRIPSLVSVKAAELGPVRVAFEVKQKDKKSEFTTYICLTDGGETVEVYNEIEWQSMRTLCKNRFALKASDDKATFDLGLGAIKRENMSEKLFEVPAQKWADITDKSGEFGVSIISECKHGWDKYNDNTLRLTAIHTPKRNYRIDSMQSMMDLGLNKYAYAIYSHKGEVGADTQLQARLFTMPMAACVFDKHKGELGTSYSFGNVSTNDVIIRAIKKAHHSDSDEIIVRLNEGTNKEIKNFAFTLGDGIETARELWASEEYRGKATVKDGKLVCDFKPYEVKTFGITLKTPKVNGTKPVCTPVELKYNDNIDYIPANLRKDTITACGVEFKIGNGALACDGQEIKVADGNKLKLLCASFENEKATFIVNGKEVVKTVNNGSESFARWDLYDFGETAYIKKGHLGYEFTHTLDSDGKIQFAKGLYFWVITLDGSTVLPKDENIVVLAATEVSGADGSLVTPLYDEIENNRPFTFKKNFKEMLWYLESKLIWNINDKDDYFRHNNNGKNGRRIEQSNKHFKTRTVETVGH
ncbi:MAG: glycoside hydrolase family 38 C-terminal domain-containing protein [Eubacterium sp.]